MKKNSYREANVMIRDLVQKGNDLSNRNAILEKENETLRANDRILRLRASGAARETLTSMSPMTQMRNEEV